MGCSFESVQTRTKTSVIPCWLKCVMRSIYADNRPTVCQIKGTFPHFGAVFGTFLCARHCSEVWHSQPTVHRSGLNKGTRGRLCFSPLQNCEWEQSLNHHCSRSVILFSFGVKAWHQVYSLYCNMILNMKIMHINIKKYQNPHSTARIGGSHLF